jgi:hypothetical protein
MTTEDQVKFCLRYFCRFDEEVHAYVGYVPRLQVYAQSPTEDGLLHAVTATALRFILTCADKHMLGDIMREAQMKEVSAVELAASVVEDGESEFVSIRGYKECANPIELTVPFSAFALEDAIA